MFSNCSYAPEIICLTAAVKIYWNWPIAHSSTNGMESCSIWFY